MRTIAGASAAGLCLSALFGTFLGTAGGAFVHGEGGSYLSDDPRACVNCHIMRDQYDGWQKASHHAHAAVLPVYRKIVLERGAKGSPGDPLDSPAGREQLQRKAQFRLDFVAAENSMGFHAPQESARILGEAIDLAPQGQIAAIHAGR